VNYRRVVVMAIMLVMVAAAVGVRSSPTRAHFSDGETSVQVTMRVGTWGPPPCVTCVCPWYGPTGLCSWPVFIFGRNLKDITEIKLVKGDVVVTAKKVWPICDSKIYCVFDLRGVPLGDYDMVARTADSGCKEYVLFKGYRVYRCGLMPCGGGSEATAYSASAVLQSVQEDQKPPPDKPGVLEDPANFKMPRVFRDDKSLVVDVKGAINSEFQGAALVSPDLLVEGTIEKLTERRCVSRFDRKKLTDGPYDLLLTREDDSSLLLESAVTVAPNNEPLYGPLVIKSVKPGSAEEGKTVDLLITGDNLAGCEYVALVIAERQLLPLGTSGSGRGMVCTFDLTGAPVGIYDVYACGPGGSAAILKGCFTVTARAPVVSPVPEPSPAPAPSPKPRPSPEPVPGPEPEDELPPAIIEVTPLECEVGGKVTFIIRGSGFTGTMLARLSLNGEDTWAVEYILRTSDEMHCVFDLGEASAGEYELLLAEGNGGALRFDGMIVVSEAKEPPAGEEPAGE
jgi:hypothetical protein